jgi:hypothetical protein
MVSSETIATASIVSIILVVSVAFFFVVYPQISGKPSIPVLGNEEEVGRGNIYLIISLIIMVVVGILATKFTNSAIIGIVSTLIVAVVFMVPPLSIIPWWAGFIVIFIIAILVMKELSK